MGKVIVPDVELINGDDYRDYERGRINQNQIRSKSVSMVADTGAVSVSLPQKLIDEIGLPKIGEVTIKLADGSKQIRDRFGFLLIRIADRHDVFSCIAKPDNAPLLLGQVVFELLDFVVDCKNQRLIPNPDSPGGMINYDDY